MRKVKINKHQMLVLMTACKSDRNIAKAVGCSRQCVMRIRLSYGLKYSDTNWRNDMIIAMRKDGHSVQEIGKTYKISDRQVYRIIKKGSSHDKIP